jgi:hypothetical protein
MKKVILPVALCGVLFLLTAVSGPLYEVRGYSPVFMDYADLEHSVSYRAEARELVSPGKIYYKAPYIYINERYKGIHVINNSDPAHPVKEGFIIAPGCLDIAVKGDILYLDNSVDMVAFDLVAKKVTERIKGIFPEPLSPAGDWYFGSHEGKVLVGWKKE